MNILKKSDNEISFKKFILRVLFLVIFAFLPMIIPFLYLKFGGKTYAENFAALHWLLFFTVPISGIVFLILFIDFFEKKLKINGIILFLILIFFVIPLLKILINIIKGLL